MKKREIVTLLKKHNITTDTKRISFLGQGESNYNYLINKKYVLRICHKTRSAKVQGQIIKKLSKDVKPNLIAEGENYLILGYVKGKVLKRLNSTRLEQYAKALASFHKPETYKNLPISEAFKKEYEKSSKEVQFYTEFANFAEKTVNALKKYDSFFLKTPQCMIHTDTCLTNILFTKEKATIIDWEYARVGDPARDFALLGLAPFQILPWYIKIDKEREKILFETYAKYHDDNSLPKRVVAWRICQAFWDVAYLSKVIAHYDKTAQFSKKTYQKQKIQFQRAYDLLLSQSI